MNSASPIFHSFQGPFSLSLSLSFCSLELSVVRVKREMGKRGAKELNNGVLQAMEIKEDEEQNRNQNLKEKTELESEDHHHPYAFHVSGPRNVSSPSWKDLINSSWSVPITPFFSFSSLMCLCLYYIYAQLMRLFALSLYISTNF